MQKPEAPVCTCIKSPLLGSQLMLIRVYDPYCQEKKHAEAGSYTGPLPAYETGG